MEKIPMVSKPHDAPPGEKEIIRRRDDALRRALSTPPKPHQDMKIGEVKKKRKPKTSASSSKR